METSRLLTFVVCTRTVYSLVHVLNISIISVTLVFSSAASKLNYFVEHMSLVVSAPGRSVNSTMKMTVLLLLMFTVYVYSVQFGTCPKQGLLGCNVFKIIQHQSTSLYRYTAKADCVCQLVAIIHSISIQDKRHEESRLLIPLVWTCAAQISRQHEACL